MNEHNVTYMHLRYRDAHDIDVDITNQRATTRHSHNTRHTRHKTTSISAQLVLVVDDLHGQAAVVEPEALIALALHLPGVRAVLAQVLEELGWDLADFCDRRVVEQPVVRPPLGLLAVEVQLAQHPLQGRLGVEPLHGRCQVGPGLLQLRGMLDVLVHQLSHFLELGVCRAPVLHGLLTHLARTLLGLFERFPRHVLVFGLGFVRVLSSLFPRSPFLKRLVGERRPLLVGYFGGERGELARF
mmetsp:Transcript_32754/g.60907  ORF Transcript_32754/g.60907 Transcript_32754/m.60907 type:complete len:242 (-) Transcript_32754:712-1437(-)